MVHLTKFDHFHHKQPVTILTLQHCSWHFSGLCNGHYFGQCIAMLPCCELWREPGYSGARTSWISLAPASCCQYTRHTQAHTDNDQSDPWQWLSFETEMRGWWAPLLPISGNVLIFPSDFQTGPRLWLSGSMRMVWVRSNTRNILCLLPSLWHKVTANKSELFRSNTSPAWTKLSWLDTGADSSPSLLALLDRYHSRQNVNVMMASLAFSTSPHGSVFLKTIPVSGVTNI